MFSPKIYGAWKEKQRAKYEQAFPQIKPFLSNHLSCLDYGIGFAWLEEFLQEKGASFSRVVGFDVSEEAVHPKRAGVEYFLSEKFDSKEQFDFVVCFDAYHLTQENLLAFVKKDGLLLVSLPLRWKEKLNDFKDETILVEGEIGIEERDHFLLVKKTSE
jgi:SAM-dependent methyltransferase